MNNKGFTLVELLAVIVILAIILAIAVPAITNLIDNSKRNTFLSNAKLLMKSVQLKLLENNSFDITTLNKNNVESLLGIDGDLYDTLLFKYDSNGKVYMNVEGANNWKNLVTYGTFDNLTTVSNIVSAGLVLHLDAGNPLSYSGTGTSWNDLSIGSKTVSLTNGTSFVNTNGGTMAFDGIDDTAVLSNSVNLSTQWTIEVGLLYTNKNKSYEFFLGTPANTGAVGKILLRHNGFVSYSYPVNTYNNFNVSSTSISEANKTLTFVSTGTNVKIYVDGILSDTKAISNAPMDINTIGNAWSDNVWLAKFNLYFIHCYNKALSDSEILQNYNATKGRY